MRRIYIADNPPEAHLVRGYLEAAGITAIVQGEDVYAARGGLPITNETAPSVWVAEDDAAQAARLVAEFFDRSRAPAGTAWRCPNCGELLEPQFTACWNCRSERRDPQA